MLVSKILLIKCASLLLCSIVCVFSSPPSAVSRQQANKPITKDNLVSSLKLGRRQRATAAGFIELIKLRGVDFALSPSDEQEIRRAGDYLGQKGLDDVIAAIRRSFAKELDLFGALTPDTPILLKGAGLPAHFEIGDSGTIFILEGFGDKEFLPVLTSHGCRLVIENIDGQTKISTQIRDWSGSVVAELIRNEWKVSPATWDRNYTKNALEVKDATGHIVLQVRALADRIQLQGEWWSPEGKGLRIVKSPYKDMPGGLFIFVNKEERDSHPTIEPIFKYPSRLHFGELRKR